MELNLKEIQELIKLINKSNLTEFKMKHGEFQLSIRTKKYGKGGKVVAPQQQILPVQTSMPTMQVPQVSAIVPTAQPEPAAAPDSSKKQEAATEDTGHLLEIRSPIVGTFYRSSSPDKPPYMKPGQTVEVGQTVCIVEAMKLFNEIESEIRGKIIEVLVDDASPVEYDQVLFTVDPNG